MCRVARFYSPGDESPLSSGRKAPHGSQSDKPRPRSPLAMAHFDYKVELEGRIREEGSMPDAGDAFELLAAHRINAAIEQGEFDNLPGEGKPLNQTDDYSNIEHKLLKNANVLPDWVELGKEVRLESKKLRKRIANIIGRATGFSNGDDDLIQGSATRFSNGDDEIIADITQGSATRFSNSEDHLASRRMKVKASHVWKTHESDLWKAITQLNRMAAQHNNKAPSALFHIAPLCIERELNVGVEHIK
eukprot:CAMPEP_0198207774 /NCGR_PEP_ID=MMETSP1445-20131203/11201_1 /TAXON_ID=36898 /ORGANISM="Pyramimonas sp., Strain CCMP2087" /LENGTH=246 /DNA_ID=CAMNT_0043880923 /DNA_START=153 /DNA_END=893 /DNA_ORIENTATION=-